MFRSRIAVLATLAAVLVATAASAQVPYRPLAQGNTWTYVTDGGLTEIQLVTGQTSLLDQDVWVVEYPVSDENADLENYWTEGADGDVLLHGFWRTDWGYAYDPPVVLVDGPLELGRTWSTTFDVYSLPDLTFVTSATAYFEVQSDGIVVVPAGSFEAFGVASIEPPLFHERGEQFTLTGERPGPVQRDIDSWWSQGVGEVQYDVSGLYKLESFQLNSVAVQARTWSGVKSLFD